MTRKAVLSRDPLCKVCNDAISTEVVHIVPLEDGGDPYRLEGLQGICSPCHWAKTARENAARARGGSHSMPPNPSDAPGGSPRKKPRFLDRRQRKLGTDRLRVVPPGPQDCLRLRR
jgi:5-methylcytosine-specific restriction endonuclease McrA